MGLRDWMFAGVMIAGVGALAAVALGPPGAAKRPSAPKTPAVPDDLAFVVSKLDEVFESSWRWQGLSPAPHAPDLALMRRLSLSLAGTVPSLEEVRRFERRDPASRLDAWLGELLHDRRTADYLAERFARAYVGTEDGPFLLFRRRRFTTWLSDAILENRPYDQVVRDLIVDGGLWTDHPATNFVTVTFNQERQRPDPERLAARVSRAFLGVRLDCAQCHDHPFRAWKQDDFRGLAAFFGGVYSDLRGIREGENDYQPIDRATKAPAAVEPRVPFLQDLVVAAGSPRERLGAWLTNPANTYLARATANRVWALLFGRPLCEPVDDLPPDDEQPEALKLLADDFVTHHFDLQRLIRLIAGTAVFRLDSARVNGDEQTDETESAWASFPIKRLRPEQVAGALSQTGSVTTLDDQSNWLVRLSAFTGRNEFVKRYGDAGEDEFEDRSGTISQRLLLMNGELARDKTRAGLFSAASRIAQQASGDARAVEAAYLAVLTRRPTPGESAYFSAWLSNTTGDARAERMCDVFWTLINSTEFSWNH